MLNKMRTSSLANETEGGGTYDRRGRATNDRVPLLYGVQQLYSLRLDLESPRFKTACDNLGILPQECVPK